MASVSKDSKGYRIRFVMPDGTNKTIRVSGFNKTKSEEIARHVTELVAARAAGCPIDRRTANWLADIGQNVHDKLSSAGLIEKRVSPKLGEFIAGYIERADVSPGTKMNFRTVERNLVDYFGADKLMRSVKAADAKSVSPVASGSRRTGREHYAATLWSRSPVLCCCCQIEVDRREPV
jgi:hypothetical protein